MSIRYLMISYDRNFRDHDVNLNVKLHCLDNLSYLVSFKSPIDLSEATIENLKMLNGQLILA